MLDKIRNFKKIIKLKEYKEKYYSKLGPFGEERHEYYFDSDKEDSASDYDDLI